MISRNIHKFQNCGLHVKITGSFWTMWKDEKSYWKNRLLAKLRNSNNPIEKPVKQNILEIEEISRVCEEIWRLWQKEILLGLTPFLQQTLTSLTNNKFTINLFLLLINYSENLDAGKLDWYQSRSSPDWIPLGKNRNISDYIRLHRSEVISFPMEKTNLFHCYEK